MNLPAHSKIGASSSKRWLTCPGSIPLSKDIPNRGSTYAMEGTAAHQLAEMCLNEELDAQYFVATNSIITVRDNGAEYPFPVTQEMADAVQVYLDFVRDGEPFDTLVEVKFHLKDLHEGLFGTADCVQWFADEGRLRVVDYKHGQGTPVEAVGNPQGMYYALGALTTLRFPARVVEIVIVQPRCPHADGPIRSWTIGVDELLDWQADLLDGVKRVELAADVRETYAEGEDDTYWVEQFLAAGDHCKFCPAAGVPGRCSAIDGKQQALARVEFEPLVQYDPVKLAQALEDMPAVEARIKAIREFAYAEAEAGRAPPGWKLVEKRATRKWREDESVVANRLLEASDLEAADLYAPDKMLSPAQIEKLLPKDQRSILEELTVRESSGHTLAPAGDKRAAVKQSAQLDFLEN